MKLPKIEPLKLPINYDSADWQTRRAAREQYVAIQDGFCCHCSKPLEREPNMDKPIDWRRFPGGSDFLRHPVHLHHCHKTGMTIGAVHAYCNAVLWQYYGE